MKGRFITLEGGEGAGKSTQARRLAEHLRADGREVVLTREPGGSPGAERLREVLLSGEGFDPLAESMLHAAARAEHVAKLIRPALLRGADVVCDRFADSTMAYQHFGQGADVFAVLHLVGLIGLKPDRTFVLDVSPAVADARLAGRGRDRYERLDAAFHARVREGFRSIAASDPIRCMLIDADADQDTVARAIATGIASPLRAAGEWTIAETDDEMTRNAISLGLDAYNTAAAGRDDVVRLTLAAHDAAGRLGGGLHGAHYYEWMFVAWLWVAEPFRGAGLGRDLLAAAEDAARRAGCRGVYLDTFSFQAPDFYVGAGYEEFGRLDGYPAPHDRRWMRKLLASPSPEGGGPG